ncbi:MAG: hypothetical protein SGCHY_003882 [Lobulomycetales sp.]
MRAEVRLRIASVPTADIHRLSARVLDRLAADPVFQGAERVSVFLNMPGKELDTEPILHHLFARGTRVLIPQCVDKTTMRMVHLASLAEYHNLPRNSWGIKEYPSSFQHSIPLNNEDNVDLVLVPGVAFDRMGNRLGHGRGYYDRWIRSLSRRPALLALAMDCQIVEKVPVAEDGWDVPVDSVITPTTRFSRPL